MNKKTNTDRFSDYQFLELFIAIIKKKNLNSVISSFNLESSLVQFYNKEEYKELFSDITLVKDIDLEYVDLGRSLLVAFTWGLLNLVEDASFEIKYIISITDKEADDIISMHKESSVNLMNKLISELYVNDLDNKAPRKRK